MKFYLMNALVFIALVSCKTSSSADSQMKAEQASASPRLGIGMNDLSIFLPRSTVKGLDQKLPSLADANDSDSYMPEDALETVQAMLKNVSVTLSEETYKAFKPTSIRFVPCANDLELKGEWTACIQTMQVIWQMEDDRSFHTIYGLSRAEFQEVVDAMKDLHAQAAIDTEALPLQVHPIISREGVDGNYFKTVLQLFKKHAHVTNMIGYATMQSNNFETWVMGQFLIKDGHSVVFPLPFANATKQTFTDSGARRHVLGSSPLAPITIPDIPFGDGGMFGPVPAPEKVLAVKAERVKNAFLIENPSLHNTRNMDCAGCHFAHFTLADRPDGFVPPADSFRSKHWNLSMIAPTKPKSINLLSLQMFSYERGTAGVPKITQRVINETAVALDTLVSAGFAKAPAGWD